MKKYIRFISIRFLILLAFELILCFLQFAVSMKTQAPITFHSNQMELLSSDAFIDSQGGASVKDSTSFGPYAVTPEFLLQKGSYQVTVHYFTSHEGGLIRKTNPYVVCNNLELDPYRNHMTFSLWAPTNTSTAFDITNNGGKRILYSISVQPTHAWARVSSLALLCFFALLDLPLFFLLNPNRLTSFSPKFRLVCLALFSIIFLSNLPLLMDPLVTTGDLYFHLARIQGLADGLSSKMLPVRIMPGLANGNGYASSIFYGDLFLYFPAVLRLIGFSLQSCYKFFLFSINTITVFISYFCFLSIFKNELYSLTVTALYVLSPYRLLDIYTRGAVGEYSAMVFLPLIIYFMFEVYNLRPSDPHYKRLILPGLIGFSGIILSHVISCALVAILVLVTCLLSIKKTLRPATFTLLTKTALLTVAVCLWFLLPFVDYYFSHELRVNTLPADVFSFVSHCIYPLQLFDILPHADGQSLSLLYGLAGDYYFSLGLPLLFSLGCFIYCSVVFPSLNKDSFFKAGWSLLAVGLISTCMATTIFPWYSICNIIPFLGNIVSSIQFPWRFLSPSVCVLSFVGGIGIHYLHKNQPDIFPHLFSILLVTIVFSCGSYYHDLYRTAVIMPCYDLHDIYNTSNYDNNLRLQTQLSYAEYLPASTPMNDFWSYTDLLYNPNLVSAEIIEEHGLCMLVYAENHSEQETSLTLPRTFYRDYHVTTPDGIEISPITQSKTAQIEILLPAGFSGQLELNFKVPWYWHAAELISIITILLLLIFSFSRIIHSKTAAPSNDKVAKEFS